MIITGASVVAFLLMLVVAFSGSRDVQWHVDRLVLSFNQMGDAARSKDANGFLDAFVNYVLVQESAYINRTTLDREINTMQGYELIAIENQIEFAAEYAPRISKIDRLIPVLVTNPNNLKRMMELSIKFDKFQHNTLDRLGKVLE